MHVATQKSIDRMLIRVHCMHWPFCLSADILLNRVFFLSIALSKSNRIIHSFEEIAHLANDTIITYLLIKMQFFLSFFAYDYDVVAVGFNPYRLKSSIVVICFVVVLITLNKKPVAWMQIARSYAEKLKENLSMQTQRIIRLLVIACMA